MDRREKEALDLAYLCKRALDAEGHLLSEQNLMYLDLLIEQYQLEKFDNARWSHDFIERRKRSLKK